MSSRPVRLAELAAINPPLGHQLHDDDMVAFVPMAAVDAYAATTNGAGVTRRFKDVKKGFTPFLAGDLLVAKITPCFENGKIAQATIPTAVGFGSTEFHVVRPVERRLDPRYLLHYLRQNHVRASGERRMTGSAGQRRVPEHFLTDLELPVPPLAEQRRIAAILDRADALRARRRAALAQLDTLTQAIFLEMFGDPARNHKHWPEKPLHNLCVAINDCPHSTPTWTSEGITCLRTSNLTAGEWDWTDHRYVSSNEYHDRSRRGYLQPGDIILSREGTVGVAAIVPDGLRACMGQRLVQLRVKSAEILPAYLLQHLLSVLNPAHIAQSMVGSTSQHLNVKELRALSVATPPISLQTVFAARLSALQHAARSVRESLTALDALFACLQHRAFRGEL